MMGLYVNFEPERIWKDVVMAYFKALYRNLSGGTDIHETLSQDNRFRGSVEPGIRRVLRENGLGCVDWIRLSQDRDWWRAVVSAVMNLRVLAPRS
jgi:hypothetical protein